jgi:phosphatidylserine/phosphatidylglycerophosphate/cardiolipin synthase-like enzyme
MRKLSGLLAAAALLCLTVLAPAEASRRHRSGLDDALGALLEHHPHVDPNAPVVLGLSPARNGYAAVDVVVQAIEEARTSVHMAAYSFTSSPIAAALVRAHNRGIEVAVVADRKENSRSYTAANFIANSGVPTRLNGNYAIMHNKFLVIDGRNVETGSFNFTEAATKRNAENALLLRNVPDLAAEYDREWRRLWGEAEALAPRY